MKEARRKLWSARIWILVGLVLALVLLCYHIFSPFMTMMLWALILAITIYPLHQMLAARIGGKQGLASTLIVLLAVAVIITPTVMLGSQFADSVHDLVKGVRDNTLQVPPATIRASWPSASILMKSIPVQPKRRVCASSDEISTYSAPSSSASTIELSSPLPAIRNQPLFSRSDKAAADNSIFATLLSSMLRSRCCRLTVPGSYAQTLPVGPTAFAMARLYRPTLAPMSMAVMPSAR